VIPYPDRVVGLLPAVTCPFLFTVTLRYVPAVTPDVGCSYTVSVNLAFSGTSASTVWLFTVPALVAYGTVIDCAAPDEGVSTILLPDAEST
jgi:hypothetical protein